MLKYFVSTHRTQGLRPNDSNSIPGTEIVDLASLSHKDPDSPICGCARSFVGLPSRQSTTTAEIVETDITPAQYISRFHAAHGTLGQHDNTDTSNEVLNVAVELLLLAAVWPVGTVVERRLHEIRVRSFPDET